MGIINVFSRGGSPSSVDTEKSMHGLRSGQKVVILKENGTTCRAEVLGVGGWPNEFGAEKLWVKEENGDYSFIESENDFTLNKEKGASHFLENVFKYWCPT